MEWYKFIIAVFAAAIASSFTDWFFTGVLFHNKYNTYPEVWRKSVSGKGEMKAIIWSMVINVFVFVVFFLLADMFGIKDFKNLLVLAIYIWTAGPLAVLITNSLFIKMHPLTVLANALGWLAKFLLAALAVILFLC